MYYPTLDEAKKLAKQGNLLPVYREIRADLETPVSAYLKVARGDHSFLLESVEGGERLGRYSVIGTDPSLVLTTGADSPVDPLKLMEQQFSELKLITIPGLPRFHGGMVGYLSYEVARYYEDLPAPDPDPQGVPESVMMMADTILIFDHIAHRIKVISHAKINGDVEAAYKTATDKIDEVVKRLSQPMAFEERLPEPIATNGEVVVQGDKGIKLGKNAGDHVILFEKFLQWWDSQFKTAWSTHTHPVPVGGTSGPPPAPLPSPAQTLTASRITKAE